MLFPTPDGVTLVENSIFFEKFPSENCHSNAQILTYQPKTKFERLFLPLSGDAFIQNLICYKKVRTGNFDKNAWILSYGPET